MQLHMHCIYLHFLFCVCFAMVITHLTTTCISNPRKTNAEIFASKCLMYLKKLIQKKKFFFQPRYLPFILFCFLYWRFAVFFDWRFKFLSHIVFLKLRKLVLVFLIQQVCWWQILLVFSHFLYIVPSFLRGYFHRSLLTVIFGFALLSAL